MLFCPTSAFDGRVALGRVQSDFDHAALLVTLGGEEWICDVGFPLRCSCVALRERPRRLSAPCASRGAAAAGESSSSGACRRDPASSKSSQAPVPREQVEDRWRETYRPESRFLKAVSLRLEKQGRTVSFSEGEIRVDDLHSRTRIGLPPPRAPLLEEQFGIDRPLLERAFALVGDPEPEMASGQVSVYLESDRTAEDAFQAISSLEGYRALMEGTARVTERERGNAGWRVRLFPPGTESGESAEAGVEEAITVNEKTRTLRVVRGSRGFLLQG